MDFLPHKCTHTYFPTKKSQILWIMLLQQQLAKEAIMEWLKIQWNLANVLIPNTRKERRRKRQKPTLHIVFPSIVATSEQNSMAAFFQILHTVRLQDFRSFSVFFDFLSKVLLFFEKSQRSFLRFCHLTIFFIIIWKPQFSSRSRANLEEVSTISNSLSKIPDITLNTLPRKLAP